MKTIENCLICGNCGTKKHNAIVVPFIAERVFNKKPFKINLLECKKCGFMFFNLRLDDDEMNKLYSGYRDKNYIKQRNKHEPWYTNRFNDTLFNNNDHLNNRRELLIKLYKAYPPVLNVKIKSILDFGGDKGQLIDQIFNEAKKYVYEISNVELLPNIEKVDDSSCGVYDFVICSNVLEHVSFPRSIIQQINKMTHDKTIFYLEVPYEQPYCSGTLIKRIFQQTALLLFRFTDFISMLKPGMFTHMHEHINYFSVNSICQLLQSEGFSNIKISIEKSNSTKLICCFAQK